MQGSPKNDAVGTPDDLYAQLDKEFRFDDFDPCPLQRPKSFDGLALDWADCTFVNPPFSRIKPWLEKAVEENERGKTVVLLVTARVSSGYWHDLVFPRASEVRFLQGKVKFAGHAGPGLPVPIAIVIFRGRGREVTTPNSDAYTYNSIVKGAPSGEATSDCECL
jgi:hypothetical protein